MRSIFVMLLLVGAAYCNPFRERWELLRDDMRDEQNKRQPFFFGPFGSDSDEDDEFPPQIDFSSIKDIIDQLNKMLNQTNMDQLPANYHNTTSTTKVVNGSLVTVNETVDKQTDKDNNTFFVETKVVNVVPQNESAVTSPSAETTAVNTELPTTQTTAPKVEQTTSEGAQTTSEGAQTTSEAAQNTSTRSAVDQTVNELNGS